MGSKAQEDDDRSIEFVDTSISGALRLCAPCSRHDAKQCVAGTHRTVDRVRRAIRASQIMASQILLVYRAGESRVRVHTIR